MPIALHRLWRAVAIEIPQRARTPYDTKHRNGRDPYIQKARREIISYWTDRTPAFIVAA